MLTSSFPKSAQLRRVEIQHTSIPGDRLPAIPQLAEWSSVLLSRSSGLQRAGQRAENIRVLSWEDWTHGNQFYGSFDLCPWMCACMCVRTCVCACVENKLIQKYRWRKLCLGCEAGLHNQFWKQRKGNRCLHYNLDASGRAAKWFK